MRTIQQNPSWPHSYPSLLAPTLSQALSASRCGGREIPPASITHHEFLRLSRRLLVLFLEQFHVPERVLSVPLSLAKLRLQQVHLLGERLHLGSGRLPLFLQARQLRLRENQLVG